MTLTISAGSPAQLGIDLSVVSRALAVSTGAIIKAITSAWPGHSYIVYGPLALAASLVVYEGLPTHPDAGRPWRIAEELDPSNGNTMSRQIRIANPYGSSRATDAVA